MAKRTPAAPKNPPIGLSGVVFFHGILAEDYPQARMPQRLDVGDIRLHNVPKKGERPRFGQTITFAGFIIASVWDGKKFRKLLLRKCGAAEATYDDPVQRRERALALMRHLRTLVRRQAFWYAQDSGYEVPRDGIAPAPVAVAAPVAAAQLPAPAPSTPAPQAEPQVTPSAQTDVTVTVTVNVEAAGETIVHATHTQHLAVRKRRHRKVKADENQLPLFPDKV